MESIPDNTCIQTGFFSYFHREIRSMKIVDRLALVIGSAGTLLLAVLFLADLISLGSLVASGIALSSLLVAGMALALLENSPRLIRYAGISCAWTGFLILSTSAYKFIELNSSWQIGMFFLALALIAGIAPGLTVFTAPPLKWIGIIAALLLLIVAGGILFKAENRMIYRSGAIVLSVFSVLALASTFIRRKARD